MRMIDNLSGLAIFLIGVEDTELGVDQIGMVEPEQLGQDVNQVVFVFVQFLVSVDDFPGRVDDLNTFYRIYAETSARDRFPIRPFGYYHDVWQSFLQDGMADLLLAEWEGNLLAGLMLFRLGHKAWYIYGASSNERRNLMPNHLLQWEAIRLGKQKGCLLYDLWGAPDILNEGDPMWGVYRFKQGFGGEFVERIGAWDFPVSRPAYWLYSHIAPRVLRAMRWWYWIHEV